MKWILLFIYLLMILGVIFLERKQPTEALLWVVVLVCLPYLGAVLYLVFGSTMAIKLTAYLRKKRLDEHHLSIPQQTVLPELTVSDEDRQVIQFNQSYNRSRLTSCDDVQIYTNGEGHYRQLFADIQNAKECIYIEFYTIHHDLMGEALVKALSEKAKQGVKVLVMCDFVANLSTPARMSVRFVRQAARSSASSPSSPTTAATARSWSSTTASPTSAA